MKPRLLFKKEKVLVQRALKSEAGEITLRNYIYPIVSRFAEYYEPRFSVPKDELISISYTYFDYTLKRYKERLVEMKAGSTGYYSFSSYYIWYIQQSIETYLGIAKYPLKEITPRVQK
jgi:hypothetical protein